MPRQHLPFAPPFTNLGEKSVCPTGGTQRRGVRRLLVGSVAAAFLVGWASGAGAQTEPTPPPLPPAQHDQATTQQPSQQPDQQQQQPDAQPQPQPPQQAATAPANTAPTNAGNFPALPLGHDGVRDVQTQLIALGFDPGGADGEVGPATLAAAQQYNENRGGSGPVPIDGALLTRLQQDTGPRLTPQQVAARTQPRYQAQAPSNPLVGAMQQFESNLRGLFNGR